MSEITADTETHLIERAKLAPKIVCYQHAIDDGPEQIHLWKNAPIEEHLTGQNVFVTANGAYDFACIINERPDLIPLVLLAYDEGRIVDVQLDAKLLDIAAGEYEWRKTAGWSLEALAKRCGMEIEKETWRLRFAAYENVPVDMWPVGAREYALADPRANRVVRKAQLISAAQWRTHGVEVLGVHSQQAARTAFGLHLASCWGVMADRARTTALERRIEMYLGSVEKHLQDIGLVRRGGSKDGSRDTKAAAKRMVSACLAIGRPVPLTKGGLKTIAEAEAVVHPSRDVHAYCRQLVSDKKAALLTRAQAFGSVEIKRNTYRTYEELLAEDLANTPQGIIPLDGVQLDRDACILAHDEDLYLYAEFTGANLIRGRCERLKQGFDLPLQTRFDPLKETSRVSSTQPQPPLVGEQMQNFPRSNALTKAEQELEKMYGKPGPDGQPVPLLLGLREAFTPRPDNTFIGADYSMAELHTVAQLCYKLFGFSKLGDLLNAGVDVHWWLAAQTLGLTYEQVRENESKYKTDRQRVKPGNFGFWGGMGADKFILYSRKGFNIVFTVAEAKRFKAQWRAAFPETKPYFDWIGGMLGDHESFTYVHPITGFVRGDCRYTDGSNHGFQHLCAYGAKDAIWQVTKACFTPGSALYGWRMWNFVHDEILLEGPCAGAREAAKLLQQIMEQAFNRYVPDVPTHAEPFITPIWSKKCETVRNATGELETWQPILEQLQAA